MIKKSIAAVLILMFCASPVMADDRTVTQVAAGLAVLNALFGGAGRTSSQNNEQVIKIKRILLDHAEKFSKSYAQAASEVGPDRALMAMKKMFMEKNISAEITKSEVNEDNSVLTVYDPSGEELEFEVDTTKETVTVTARLPQIGVYERVTSEFSTAPKMVINIKETPFNMLESAGFDVADKKSDTGFLILYKIRPGSAMANLGALPGSELLRVNNINTKNCQASQLREYVEKCAKSNERITVVFVAVDGSQKTIEINLQ